MPQYKIRTTTADQVKSTDYMFYDDQILGIYDLKKNDKITIAFNKTMTKRMTYSPSDIVVVWGVVPS